MINVFEKLLCFDAWTRKAAYWNMNDTEAPIRAKLAIQNLLKLLQEKVPRKDGQAWRLAKFHEMLHLVDEIMKYGALREYAADRPEHNHIAKAKRPGRRAQKRHKTFERQTATRLADTLIINRVFELNQTSDCSFLVDDESDSDSDPDVPTPKPAGVVIKQSFGQATRFLVESRSLNSNPSMRWFSESALPPLIQPLLQFMIHKFQKTQIHCCTEYVRNDYCFRCHPNYKKEGRYYDWAMIDFEVVSETGEVKKEAYPCRICAVVPKEPNNFKHIYLIVQSAQKKLAPDDSILFQNWEFADDYYVVYADAIKSPVFVVEVNETTISTVLQYDEWPDLFVT